MHRRRPRRRFFRSETCLVLAISLLMMRYSDSGRGLHDLAGGTVVVSDPKLDPETQRQKAMRMRLGRAG